MVTLTIAEANKRIAQIRAIGLDVNDKLSHAGKRNIDRMTTTMKPLALDYQERVDDINISYAATNEKGVLLVDENGHYSYKPDDERKRRKALGKAQTEFEAQVIEFEPYYAQACERLMEVDMYLREELEGVLFELVR